MPDARRVRHHRVDCIESVVQWVCDHATVEPLVRSDSVRLQLAVVGAGLGAALMPAPNTVHYGFAPVKIGAKLRRSMTPWPTEELFIVTHRALRKVPRVNAVWGFLVEQAQRMSASLKKQHPPVRG